MKKIIKLSIFPVLTVVLLGVLILHISKGGAKMVAEEASGSDGLVYADYFTGNSAHHEWQFEYAQNSKSPKFVNDMMMTDGFSSLPAFSMLQYTLPSKCDIYFTAETTRRGEGANRDSAVFLNVGETFQNRYMLFFKEGTITLSYNGTKDLVNKKVEGLTVKNPNSFRISLDEKTLTLYVDGSEEPLFTYVATEQYANLAQARNFGVWGTSSEFYFDDLVITNGSNLIPVSELAISGTNGNTIEGIGTTMQMQATMNPVNCSDKGLVWKVDNTDVASITLSGLLTAKDYGKVTVTAYTRDGSKLSASQVINVKKVSGAKEGVEAASAKKTWCLADDYSIVYESENPDFLYPMSPYVTVLESGRIMVAFDLNGDGLENRIPVGYDEPQNWGSGQQHVVVAYSDDDGKTWEYSLECPGLFPRVFEDGDKVYLIYRNEERKLAVACSKDDGKTWSEDYAIDDRGWHSAPTSIIYKDDYLYMTMETNKEGALAPILIRGKRGTDLTKRENWSFSEELTILDVIPDSTTPDLDYTGIMEYSRNKDGLSWLEGNVIQMYNEASPWYDASMNSFYIMLRSQVYRSGYAAVMKVTENADGTMTPSVITTEAGNTQMFVAMPGGHDKFSIIYDEESGLYWLASNFSDNSILNRKYTTGDKQGQSWSERDRLALYFSTDAMNWNFAGMIAEGDSERESRAYPHVVVDGEDLLVVTRCGTKESSSQHDNNILSFHRIKDFRDLVY